MKLLALDQFSDLGGAQQCLLDLLPALCARGWDVRLGLPGCGALVQRAREMGIETAPIRCGPFSAGAKSAADMARFVAQTPALAREISRLAKGSDLIYINGPRLLPAAARAGLRAPVLFHSHSYVPPGAQRRLAAAALRRMHARVVASCEFVAEQWKKSAERVSIVYNGVPGPATARESRTLLRAGCIGRIAPEKGQREFVEAARLIRQIVPEARFFIYGAPLFSEGRYAEEVKAAAGSEVEFCGWVDDVYKALANLDCVLVPSAPHEATTRVVLEAFAAEVPVIAFRSGGIPEVIEHGRTGFLADGVEEMARLAVEVLRGNGERVIEAARERWEQRFTINRWREEMVHLMLQMTSSEPRR